MISEPSLSDSFFIAQQYLDIRTGKQDQAKFAQLLTSDTVCIRDHEEIGQKESVVDFFREHIFSRSSVERKGSFTLNGNRIIISIKSSSSGLTATEEVELCDLKKIGDEWKISKLSIKFFYDASILPSKNHK